MCGQTNDNKHIHKMKLIAVQGTGYFSIVIWRREQQMDISPTLARVVLLLRVCRFVLLFEACLKSFKPQICVLVLHTLKKWETEIAGEGLKFLSHVSDRAIKYYDIL